MEAAVIKLESEHKPGDSLTFAAIMNYADIQALCRRDPSQFAALTNTLRARRWTDIRNPQTKSIMWVYPMPLPEPESGSDSDDSEDDLRGAPHEMVVYRHGRRVSAVPRPTLLLSDNGIVRTLGDFSDRLLPTQQDTVLVLVDLGSGGAHLEPLFKLMFASPKVAEHIRVIICADKSYNNFPVRGTDTNVVLPPGVIVLHNQKDAKNLTDLILLLTAADWIARYGPLLDRLRICITSNDKLIREAGAIALEALSALEIKINDYNPSAAANTAAITADWIEPNFVHPYINDL